MNRFHALLVPALLALLALLAGCTDRRADYFPGYAEGDYVRLSSAVGGTLIKLYLERGANAAADAPAFELERESEQAAWREAESRLRRAQAQVANLSKGARPDEVAAVRAQLAQAEAALTLSQAELKRQQRLAAVHFIAPAQLDQARAGEARDRARVDELRAQLRVTRLGARSDEIAAAQQDVLAAQAQLAQAAWVLDQKSRRVPVPADVVDVLFREGEWVPAGSPVVSLLPPQNIKARFFVEQAVLGQLRLGQRVTLRCDGCGAPLEAAISFIAREAEYTAPIIYSKENRATLVFMIEARPAPEQARRLHPGQPLEVRLAGDGQ
jgi:HlyD family secretion protein